ncbi:hypothetical protein LJB97_02930 [Parabacteroides sp. OttesenSCG-928-O15]|nr:hypothetical protein [Parabacteroides sp. OttesenSCG-928-O15]
MMKRYWLHFILIAFFLLQTACDVSWKPAKRKLVSLEEVPTVTLPMETITRIQGEGYEYTAPDFQLIGDTLIALLYSQNASLLRFYSLSGEPVTRTDIRKKTETYNIPGYSSLTTSFSFLHPVTNIFYEYEVKEGNLRLPNYVRMRMGENSPKGAVRLDEENFAFIGYFQNGLWGLWHEPTRILKFSGNYPVAQEYTPLFYLPYYEGRIDISGNQIAYASYQFGYISSYRYANKKLTKLWETQVSDFIYKEKGGELVFDPHHKTGFIEAYFAGNYVYTLYNGYDDFSDETSTNSIIVFSRDKGEPIARYILPEAISYMKFDSKGANAYATYTAEMEEFYIVRFRLPDLP